MKKKRVAVVGKGTAGSQGVLHFFRYLEDVEIVWYFDPARPTQSVGEGSTLELPSNMYNDIGFFNNDLKKVNGTFKTGIYKENWGLKNKEFFHHFPPPNASYHFSAVELQDYIHNFMKDKVEIVEKDVDYTQIDADFILNASGKPSSFDRFNTSNYIPVNAAYVVQCAWDYPAFDYTLCIAGKHGWIFGIPLQNRLSIGYIYNETISKEEDLLEEVAEIFDRYGLAPTKEPNRLSFSNYFRKTNYENQGRVVHTGNASFFLEPLEATSIGTMDRIQRAAFDIWTGAKTSFQANKEYLDLMHKTELVIMLHYAAGSKFGTDFWRHAEALGIKKLKDSSNDYEFNKLYKTIRNIEEMRFAPDPNQLPDYGPWWAGSFVQNLHGLDLFDRMDKIFK